MNDRIFNDLLYELFVLADKGKMNWIRGKDNDNQYTCIMPNGFEILIDSYTVMDYLNINLSVFLNQKLVVERVMHDDFAKKLYNKISEANNLSYEDGIVLELLRYLWSERRGV
jgi:hypothetical protein